MTTYLEAPLEDCFAGGGGLRATLSFDTGRAVVALHGELDLCTAGDLDEVLATLRDRRFRHIVIDLSGLTFMAVAGVRSLSRAVEDHRLVGGTLELSRPSPFIRRVLTMTQHGHLLRTGHPS